MNNFEVIRIRTIGVDGLEMDFRPSAPIDIIEYTYVSSRMSGSTLTAEVRDVECLDSLWTGREFVDVMEGGVSSRYRLVGVPSSRKDVDDARYVHSLVFESERDTILSGLYFCDAVDGDAASVDKYQSGSYEVFFHGTLSEFVSRFNDVLEFRGVRGLRVRLEAGVESEKKEYSVSSATLFGALQEAYKVWEVPFYFSGDDIVFGEGGEAVPNAVFGYGSDRELVGISKTNQGAKVVTLCAGTGSSENIPYYYPNETPYGRMGAKLNGGEGVSVEDGVKYAEVVGRSGELVYAGDDPGDATDSVTYNGKVTSSGVGSAFATDVEFVSGKACPVVFSTRFAMNGYRGKVDLDFGLQAGFKGEDELIYNHIGPERMTGPMDPHRVAEEGFDFDITSVMVSISGPSTDIYRAGDFPYETFYGEAKTGEVEALVDGKVVYLRCQDFQRASNPVKGVSIDLEEVLKGQNVDVRDCTCIVTVLANVKTHVNWFTRKNGETKGPATFIFTNIGFSRFFEPSGWLLNGKSTFLSLASMGLRMDREPIIGDKISPVVLQYIRPTGVLMPSVYRETLGAERALPALNGEYLLPGETDKYYHFDNEYDASNPREHVQAFEDVKPSIENLKDEAGNPRNVLEGVHFDPGYNVIETKEGSSELKYSHFFVKIVPLGFNLFDHALEGGEMGLIMLDGDCGACRFNILVTEDGKNAVQVDENGDLKLLSNGYVDINDGNIQEEQNDTTDNAVWLCLALDSQTYGGGEFGVMPSYDSATGKGQKPQAGEKYTLIDIRMPEEHIRAAEKELDAQIVKFMSENNDDKYSFSVNFSRIYLAQNPEVRDALSSHCSLRLFYDGAELAAPLHVVQYTRKQTLGEALPEISVELGDIIEAPSSGLRERIATELGTMIHTVQGSTKEEASDKYLRKDVEDVSEALTGFLKGIKVGEYVPGLGGRGGAIIPNADGEVIAEVDYLNVRKKATFAEVVLDKIRSVGGKTLISLASMGCSAVEPSENAYKCYFSTDDGEGGVILNDFVVGDLAICQSFSTNNTKYYWRKVVAVGEGYVTLSDVSGEYAEGSDIPAKGDSIVQLGHVSDVERQNAIILSAYGESTPSIVQYKGINSFSLAGKEITILSPKNNLLTGIVKMTAGSSGLEQFEEWAAKQELIDSKASGEDIENLGKEIAGLDYLKAAVKEDTTILGGLVQTSTIKLGYTDEQGVRHTMSGTNGRYMPDKKGGGIAAWWGGDFSEESAKALVRFDGTGFFADGLFKWDDETGVNLGNDAIKLNYDGTVEFGEGIKIGTEGDETLGTILTSLAAMGKDVTRVKEGLIAKLDKSLFDTLFAPHYDKDGKLESIEAKVGLWSPKFISARTSDPSAGGGSGGGEGGKNYLNELLDVNLLASALTTGDMLMWDSTRGKYTTINRSELGSGGGGGSQAYDSLAWSAIKSLTSGSASVLAQAYAVKQAYNELKSLIPNLADYYTKEQINALIPSLEGYATEDYVKTSIANLINGAPTTLDTLKEIADAFAQSQDVIEALDEAIGKKANQSDLTALAARVAANEGNITSLSSNKLDKSVWDSVFEIDAKGNLRAKVGIYSTSFISARTSDPDSGSGGGGGGAFSLYTWDQVKAMTAEVGGVAPTAYALKQAYNELINATPILSWNNIQDKPIFATVATSGKYSDLIGRPTALSDLANDVGYITAAALAGLASESWVSNNYLPLSGGTITGDIALLDNTFIRHNTRDGYALLGVLDYEVLLGTEINPLRLRSNGISTINGNTLIHSGNIGSQSVSYATSAGVLTTSGNIAAQANSNRSVFFQNYITFDSNASYGIYRGSYISGKLGATDLYISAQNAIVLEAGKVGIGTISPQYDLHVDGTMYGNLKMLTPRTIWGQSFDGTGDITGAPSFPSFIDINRNAYTGALLDSSKMGFEIETYADDVRLKTYTASSGSNPSHLVLTSNGNVLIGTTTDNGSKLQVNGNLTATGTIYSAVGMYSPGYITARSTAGSSDRNLKTNIAPVKNALAYILGTNYVSFDWKDTGEHSVGIIAQEELNREWSCLVQKYSEHYSYQYTQHTALIGSALQEEDKKVEALKTEVATLKAEVATLKAEVQRLRNERQLWQQ